MSNPITSTPSFDCLSPSNKNNKDQEGVIRILEKDQSWIYRRFQKDAKIRTQERYWHRYHLHNVEHNNHKHSDDGTVLYIIPDALSWRKYVSLISKLMDAEVLSSSTKDGTDDNNDNGHANHNHSKRPCCWMLLETVVEYMDYRNMSQCEMTGVQERTKLQRMIRNTAIQPFCDASVRIDNVEEDEWNIFNFENMNLHDRSYHSMMRVARMILQQQQQQQQHQDDPPTNNIRIILLVDELYQSEVQEMFQTELLEFYSNTIQLQTMSELLHSLHHETESLLEESSKYEQFVQLQKACDDTYSLRNPPPSAKNDTSSSGNSIIVGPTQHLSDLEIQQNTQTKGIQYYYGRLEVTSQNSKEGYVTCSSGGSDSATKRLFINQAQKGYFNRSFHHDFVVVQELPQSEWSAPMGRKRLIHHTTDNDNPLLPTNVVEDPPIPSGRVVAIQRPSRRLYVCTLIDTPSSSDSMVLVVPMDRRIPKIRISTKSSWSRLLQKRCLVEIDSWEVGSNYPRGHVTQILGAIGDLETEILCLLHEHEISLQPFSKCAIACLPPLPLQSKDQQKAAGAAKWTIPLKEIQQRRDLRYSHQIFSVDPPGCQDIDDTMHAKVLPNGDIEIGVHIADVTYFVRHNSALDKEAQERGTTFYLVDRRYDMLPSLLSSDLCSLHGGIDRLAVSVIWTMSPDLEVMKDCWYGRTVIHNCQAMTYEQAHNILDDKPPDDPSKPHPPPLTAGAPVDATNISSLKQDLQILTRLARKLRKDREEIGGAVDLSSGDLGSELKFVLDDQGQPTRVSAKKEMEIHHTIAEMMIMANQYVANKIFESFPASSLLRIHQTVQEDRFEDLKGALKAGGVSFDGSSNMALARSLDKAKQTKKSSTVVNSLWQSLATRAMSEAKYICTGDQTGADLTHYGLGIDKYTHFTSPIRRYADVVVHKQLLAALDFERIPQDAPAPETYGTRAQTYLGALPESNVISILGNSNESGNKDLVDSLITEASEMTLDSKEEISLVSDKPVVENYFAPYGAKSVTSICDGLNSQNRKSKLSSFECQRLFLSLYFRDNTEVAQAVVTGLRQNGLLVYVPQFDMKGPVFLSDMDGNVQINPTLLGLPAESGSPPTRGFAAAKECRILPSGSCTLVETADESNDQLVITVPESTKKCEFRVLDVVTVRLSCDTFDTSARIPSPKLHLISKGYNKTYGKIAEQTKVSSKMLQTSGERTGKRTLGATQKEQVSLYSILSSGEIRPLLKQVPFRLEHPLPKEAVGVDRVERMRGRIVFGGYANPDTLVNAQSCAAAAAAEEAAKRRAVVLSNQTMHDYEASQRVEKSVTDRMQRLASAKRNTRRSKAK